MRRAGTLMMSAIAVVLVAGCAAGQEEKRFEINGIGGGGGLFSPIGSPHDPKLVFVSCDMGGFYVSENGGETWWMCNAFQMRGSTTCRPAFHPKDPNVVYMPYKASELRVSVDKGYHWKVLCADGGWSGSRVNAVITDRGGDGRVVLVCTSGGLFRSDDGGKTFAKCEEVAGAVIWAHFDQTTPVNARRVIAGTSEGVFVSVDNGKTWAKKGAGIDGKLNGFAAGSDPLTGRSACYAATDKTICRSADGGVTFEKVGPAPPAGNFRFVCMAESRPDVCYVTTSSKWGVLKTTDGGATWSEVFRFLSEWDGKPIEGQNVVWGWLATDLTPGWGGSAIGFGVNPRHPDYAMFTNTGELFVTDNGGKNWRQAMSKHVTDGPVRKGDRWACIGLEVTTVWKYHFDPFDRNRTYVCYTDIGFIRSTDRGQTWHMAVQGSPWKNTFYNLVFDPARKGVLYAAASTHHDIPGWTNVTGPKGQGGGVVMSVDHAETWTNISGNLPTDKFPCTCVALDPDSPVDSRTLYAAMHGDGVWKSADGGKTWAKKSAGVGREGNMGLYLVRIGPDKALYALVTAKRKDMEFPVPGGLWKSADGGETWTELTKGLDLWWPTEFAIHPNDPKKIWISTADVPRKSGGGVFYTGDGGETWKQALTKDDFNKDVCAFVHCFAMAFHPQNPDVMYLSVWTHGLFRSDDAGKSWKRIEGIPSETGINRITFDPEDGDKMIVTTFGKGFWHGPAKGY